MAHTAPPRVTVGVDTHKDLHVAAARDQLGRRLATTTIGATSAGYAELLGWALGLGEVTAWGVEGTGSYGAGLARFLAAHGQRVLEVNRPDRAARRRHGKSDPVDADAAARAVQAGEATGVPKAADGTVEMVRALRAARQTAVKARTQAINALKGLLVTAPTELREQLDGLSTPKLVGAAVVLEPGTLVTPTAATMLALCSLAGRYQHLDAEIKVLTGKLDQLTAKTAPAVRALHGVGPDSAAALRIAAGTTRDGCAARPRSLRCAAAPPWRPPRARPAGIASTEAVTAKPTPRSTASCSCGCAGISPPATTSPGAPPRARPARRSSAASLVEYRGCDPEPWVMAPR